MTFMFGGSDSFVSK